jgi:hypothetical protein
MASILISAPVPTLLFDRGWHQIQATVPAPTIAITGYVSGGSMLISAPVPEIEIVTATPFVDLPVPAPRIEMVGGDRWYTMGVRAPPPEITISSYFTIGDLSITAPRPTIDFSIGTGSYDALSITAPDPTVLLSGHTNATATVAITAPSPTISIVSGGSTYHCSVLNTDTWEVTEYSNFNFDQLVKFGDQYLGVNSTGIYLLGGDTDNNEIIDSIIETGRDDFDDRMPKRIANNSGIMVGWNSSEDGKFTLIMDGSDEESYEYDLPATNGKTDSARVKVGHPKQKTYINFKIENEAGADFDLYSIETILSIRKVLGK